MREKVLRMQSISYSQDSLYFFYKIISTHLLIMEVDFCPVLCIPKVAILQAFWGISRFVWCRKMTDIISVQILGLQLGVYNWGELEN